MLGSFNGYFQKHFLNCERPNFMRNKGMRRTQSLNRASTFRYFCDVRGIRKNRDTLFPYPGSNSGKIKEQVKKIGSLSENGV
jgi:hypothetical protein